MRREDAAEWRVVIFPSRLQRIVEVDFSRIAVDGLIATPITPGDDFNDLHVREGIDAVRAALANPQPPIERLDAGLLARCEIWIENPPLPEPPADLPPEREPENEPVSVHLLDATATPEETRQALRDHVHWFMQAVKAGSGQNLAIASPAGIGKSHIVGEAIKATPGLTVNLFVPTHALGAEQVAKAKNTEKI